MATPEKPRNENDYILNHVKIISHDGKEYDFSSHFLQFTYEEGIFNIGVHGQLFAIDAVDYPTLLPFIGQERIKISFTRQDEKSENGDKLEPIEFELPIYKMDGQTQDAGSRKRQVYTLYFTSESAFKNLNTRVFKTYKNMPYSDMVEKIYDTYLKDDKPLKGGPGDTKPEKTKYPQTYIVQNMSPTKAILNLSSRSISEEKNGYYFVFYEDRDQFNFVTLSKLAKQKPISTLKYKLKNVAEQTEGVQHKPKNLEEDLYNTETVKNDSGFDVLKTAMSGEGASSLFSVDPIRRKFSLKAFDLRGEASKEKHNLPLVSESKYDAVPHMGAGKPFKDDSKMFVNPRTNMAMLISDNGQDTHEYISARDKTVTPYNPEDFFLQRESQKNQMLKYVVRTTLSGDPRIRAGCTIEFEVPEFMGKVGKHAPEEKDKYMQGKYLVIAVAHIVERGKYRMNIEMVKDSFFSDIESRNPVEEYKDTY